MVELGICRADDADKCIHLCNNTHARCEKTLCGKKITSFPHDWAYVDYIRKITRKHNTDLENKIDNLTRSDWNKPICSECEKIKEQWYNDFWL